MSWLSSHWKTIAVIAVATVVFVAVTAATGGLGAPALVALGAGGFSSGVAGYVTQQLLDRKPIRPVDALKAGVVSGVVTVATAGLGRVAAPAISRALPAVASRVVPAAVTRAAPAVTRAVPAVARTAIADAATGAATGGATQVGVNVATNRPWDENLGTAVAAGAATGVVARPLADRIGTPVASAAARARGTTPAPVETAPAPRSSENTGPVEARSGGLVKLLEAEVAEGGATAGRPRATSRPPVDDAPVGPAEPVFGPRGWETPRGTSPRVGDFTGLRGGTIDDVLARIPADAKVRELTPSSTGGAQRGREYSWNDGTHTWRVRIHDVDGTAPADSNARTGWVLRVQRGKQYMDDGGTFHHHNSHNPASPHHNPDAANATHIPLAGNGSL